MRRAAVIGLLLAAVASAGCGGSTSVATDGAASSGERLERARRDMGLAEAAADDEDDGEWTFAFGTERLPEMPRNVEWDEPPLATGLARALDTLALARPEPEPDLDRAGYQTFVEEDYARWVAARAEALRAARSALGDAERGEPGEYVVASAVIGLLLARFAAAIATMPLPRAIDEVAADRLRFRDAYLRAAAPLWDRAVDAFGACASASVRSEDSSLAPWQRWCDEQLEAAQAAARPME